MSESGLGCKAEDGEVKGKTMDEQVIVTKRGSYGKVNVTLPMQVKQTMLTWCQRSGMGKTEFFRTALMMGVIQLAQNMNAKEQKENYSQEME